MACVRICRSPQKQRPRSADVALTMFHRQARRGIRPTTLGADKGYHRRDFVRRLRRCQIRPDLAQITGLEAPRLSQRCRTKDGGDLRKDPDHRKLAEESNPWRSAHSMPMSWSVRSSICCASAACE